MTIDFDTLIEDFLEVARLSGFDLDANDLKHEHLTAPHRPRTLPDGYQAVYAFTYPDSEPVVLKVGKVGANSNARYLSQHYNPNSSGSNLARSLSNDENIWERIGEAKPRVENIGKWIKMKTDRDNILIREEQGKLLLSLLEIFLQCRLNPLYEG